MVELEKIFYIELAGQQLQVETATISKQVLFHICFPDHRKPFTISRIYSFDRQRFWTSIPEGRFREAQQIGPLIEAYYRAKQQIPETVSQTAPQEANSI